MDSLGFDTSHNKDIFLTHVDNSVQSPIKFQILAEMYADYVDGLALLDPHVSTAPLLLPENNKEVQYIMIQLATENHLVPIGFFFYGLYPNAFSRHDCYIGECYIAPDFRNMQFGERVFTQILKTCKEHGLDVSYYVLKRNFKARELWDKIMTQHGYTERLREGGITATTQHPNCDFYYWVLDANI